MAQQEVVKLTAYKKTAPQSRAEIVRLGKMLPESEGIPGLIIELTKTADASGVSVTSITRGTTTPGNPFGIQQLNLQVTGRYFDVEDFLYRLEEYVAFRNASFRVTGRLLQVTTLTLSASDGNGHQRITARLRSRSASTPTCGAAFHRRLEVPNEPEPACADLCGDRADRRRGSGACRRPVQQRRGCVRRFGGGRGQGRGDRLFVGFRHGRPGRG